MFPSQRRHARARITAAALAISAATCARADVIDTTWLGGTGSWNDPTKWSGGVVPNNTADTNYRVHISDGTVANLGIVNVDSLRVDGAVSPVGKLYLGSGGTLSGSGSVSFVDFMTGTLATASGTLTIESGITIHLIGGGSVGNETLPLVNRGRIMGGGSYFYPPRVAGNVIQNEGVIETIPDGGPLRFTGMYTRAGLGTLVNPGRMMLGGIFQNTGHVFRSDASTGEWALSGTVVGGTLETGDGKVIAVPYPGRASLDDVVVNADLGIGVSTLTILNGVLRGNGTVHVTPPAIEGPSRVVAPRSAAIGSLTIDAGMTIFGGGGQMGYPLGAASGVGESDHALINHATLRADFAPGLYSTGEFDLAGSSVFNDGTLNIRATGFMYATSSLTFGNGGMLDVEVTSQLGGGLLHVNGTLDLLTGGDVLRVSLGPDAVFGHEYLIARATDRLGTFDDVPANVLVRYAGGEVFATIVPEPSAILAALIPAAIAPRALRPGLRGRGGRD